MIRTAANACPFFPVRVLVMLVFMISCAAVFGEPLEPLLERAGAFLVTDRQVLLSDRDKIDALQALIDDLGTAIREAESGTPGAELVDARVILFLLSAHHAAVYGVLHGESAFPAEKNTPMTRLSKPEWKAPALFGITAGTGFVSLALFPVFWFFSDLERTAFAETADPAHRSRADIWMYAGYGALGLGGLSLAASVPVLGLGLDLPKKAPPVDGNDRLVRLYEERARVERQAVYALRSEKWYTSGFYGSLGVGAASCAALGVFLWLGQQAYDEYLAAGDTATAVERRITLERYRTSVYAAGALGAAGLGSALFFRLAAPNRAALEKRKAVLDVQVRELEIGTAEMEMNE